MKKIGFDIHGVIDFDPDFFSELSKRLVEDGNEVHIITGDPKSEEVVQKLSDMNIEYTHFFSIVDWAESVGHKVIWTDNGPIMNDIVWDTAKSVYCLQNNIHIHIDDTPRYGKYFEGITTRFVLYEHSTMNMNMKVRQAVVSANECPAYPCTCTCPQYLLYKDKVRKTIVESDIGVYSSNDIPYDWNDAVDQLVEEIFDNLV